LPTVLLLSTPFVPLAASQARILGMPSVPTVVLAHPIGGTPLESVLSKLDAALDEIVGKLTTALPTASAAAPASDPGEWVDIDSGDEWSDLQVEFGKRGWGDGLPLVPPTAERLEAMIRGAGLAAETVVGLLAPRMGAATVRTIAANAVMAGCRPAHMPLLVAAVQAMCDRSFNLYGIQTTTHPVGPLMIVGGPLAAALGVHSGSGMFGPGPWANGVIGRAVRLMLLHVGGGRPVEIDKSTMGQPGKYTFCIAENEAASPWAPLRADRGFAADVSTVTMVGAEAPHNINDHESTRAGALLTMLAGSVAQTGQNNVYYTGEPLLVLSPEHAATIAAEGFSKDEVRRVIYEEARLPLRSFSQENIERRFWRKFPKRYRDRSLDAPVTVAQCWEDIMVVVAGGAGKHSMYIPTFGATRSVTRPVLKSDGTPWSPADFVPR
jgi:hypothetical protein